MAKEEEGSSVQCTIGTAHVNPQSTIDEVNDDGMGRTPAERLSSARERVGYATREAAIDAFGWKRSAYNHHEGGVRGFKVEDAKRYARAYKVSPSWLMGLDPDHGDPQEMVSLPNDEVLSVIVTTLLDGVIPGRVPSDDLVRELVRGLRDTLETLPKEEGASTDPKAARLLVRGIAARSSRRE